MGDFPPPKPTPPAPHTHDAGDIVSGILTEARGGTSEGAYARGDLLYASAVNTLSRRPIGVFPQVLKVTAIPALPDWGFVDWGELTGVPNVFPPEAHPLLGPPHIDTLKAAVVRGDLIVGNATPAWARFPIGPAGRYLRSNGVEPSYSPILVDDLPAHAPTHTSPDGSDPFTSTDFIEAIVKRIRESSGPTNLEIGAISDGEFLKREGSTITSGPAGADPEATYFGAMRFFFSGANMTRSGSSGYGYEMRDYMSRLNTGAVLDNYAQAYEANAGLAPPISIYNKYPQWELYFILASVGNVELYICTGNAASDNTKKFGIHIVDDDLRIISATGAAWSEESVATITMTTWYRLRVKLLLGSKVQVWLTGTLYEKTTNIPTGNMSASDLIFILKIITKAASDKYVRFTSPWFMHDY